MASDQRTEKVAGCDTFRPIGDAASSIMRRLERDLEAQRMRPGMPAKFPSETKDSK